MRDLETHGCEKMKHRKIAIASAISVCAIAGVLTIMYSIAPLAQTNGDLGIRWCNSFVPYDKRTNDFFPTHSIQPGTIEVSGMNTIELMGGDVSIHKLKYGQMQSLKKLGTLQAVKYFLDAATIKRYSQDARIIYLRPISSFGPNDFAEIIVSIQEAPGNTKPFFATAMGKKAFVSAGFQVRVPVDTDFVTTPVWWNQNTSTVLSVMADKFKVSPGQGRKALSKFVAYTTESGVGYDPDPTKCEPSMISSDLWMNINALPDDVLSDVYIATSIPPKKGKEGGVQKALFNIQSWPTID